jgi:2-iminobutanoate/2-iminopropanoate deaminase
MSDFKTLLLPNLHSKPVGKYSPGIAIRATPVYSLIFVSGQVATSESGGVVGRGNPSYQTEVVFERLADILKVAGGSLSDLVSICIYTTSISYFPAISAVRDRILGLLPPASTFVAVSNLVEEGCLVEISGTAVVQSKAYGLE